MSGQHRRTPEQIKALYGVIVNREISDSQLSERADIVRTLERETGMEFKDTADFKSKMDAFLARAANTGGFKLRDERQRRGWSISTLAKILDLSPRHLARIEAGQAPLSNGAFAFLHGDVNGKIKSRQNRLGGANVRKNAIPDTPQRGA